MISFFLACSRNSSALLRASRSRSLLELNTTQTTSQYGLEPSRRRMVPPQPISMSSEWDPRQRILNGEVPPCPNLRVSIFVLEAARLQRFSGFPFVFHTSQGAPPAVERPSK